MSAGQTPPQSATEPLFQPPGGPVIGWRDGAVVRATGIPYATAARFDASHPLDDRAEPFSARGWSPMCPSPRIPSPTRCSESIRALCPRTSTASTCRSRCRPSRVRPCFRSWSGSTGVAMPRDPATSPRWIRRPWSPSRMSSSRSPTAWDFSASSSRKADRRRTSACPIRGRRSAGSDGTSPRSEAIRTTSPRSGSPPEPLPWWISWRRRTQLPSSREPSSRAPLSASCVAARGSIVPSPGARTRSGPRHRSRRLQMCRPTSSARARRSVSRAGCHRSAVRISAPPGGARCRRRMEEDGSPHRCAHWQHLRRSATVPPGSPRAGPLVPDASPRPHPRTRHRGLLHLGGVFAGSSQVRPTSPPGRRTGEQVGPLLVGGGQPAGRSPHHRPSASLRRRSDLGEGRADQGGFVERCS